MNENAEVVSVTPPSSSKSIYLSQVYAVINCYPTIPLIDSRLGGKAPPNTMSLKSSSDNRSAIEAPKI